MRYKNDNQGMRAKSILRTSFFSSIVTAGSGVKSSLTSFSSTDALSFSIAELLEEGKDRFSSSTDIVGMEPLNEADLRRAVMRKDRASHA